MNTIHDKIQIMMGEYDRRIKKINRQKTIILSVSISILVILGVYLGYAYVQFRKLTTPKTLVGMGYDSTMKALPDMVNRVESYLVQYAPAFVDGAFNTLRHQLPVVRKTTQERIDLLIDDSLRTIEKYFSPALRSVIGSYREDILSIAQLKDKNQVYILASRIENDLRNKFDPQTNKIIDKFGTVLENIDEELGLLTDLPPAHLNQEQLLERRFLELWMQIVDHRLPMPSEQN